MCRGVRELPKFTNGPAPQFSSGRINHMQIQRYGRGLGNLQDTSKAPRSPHSARQPATWRLRHADQHIWISVQRADQQPLKYARTDFEVAVGQIEGLAGTARHPVEEQGSVDATTEWLPL